MSSLQFDALDQLDAINTLLAQADELLESGVRERYEHRRRTLSARIDNDDPNEFAFELDEKSKLRTVTSSQYKGVKDREAARPIFAEISFRWMIRRVAESDSLFEVRSGGLNVDYKRPGRDEALRTFHFDVCRGGIDENGGRAHHPFSHFQYHDKSIDDLPRIPSIICSPVDAIEQVLLDLWPIKWPSLVKETKARQRLAQHYQSQKNRIAQTVQLFSKMTSQASLPLRGLQERLSDPLVL